MNIYDISKQAGVSIATVSRVLNNSPHVRPATRKKVLAAIEGAGYVPNAFARGLGLNTMKTIGLVCPNASDPYLAKALEYLEGAFRLSGYQCLLTCTGKEQKDRAAGAQQLIARQVDGMVLMGSSFTEGSPDDSAYIRTTAQKMPVVLLNSDYSAPNVFCVLCDDRRAASDAVELLIAKGKRRILCLHHSTNHSGQMKLEGYRAALNKHGMKEDPALIRLYPPESYTVSGIRDDLISLWEDGLRFDGVFASEDVAAVASLKFARAKGLSVPRDLSVIGYNNSEYCVVCEPELTSVDNRLKALCDRCASTLTDVLGGQEMPRMTVYTADIVQRAST